MFGISIPFLSGAKNAEKTLDIIDKTASAVSSGVDKIFYTDEEKAETINFRLELAQKMTDSHIKLMEVTQSENSIRSVSRRICAVFVMVLTLLMIIAIGVTYKFDKEWAVFLLKIAREFNIGWAFLAVIGFFFGSYLASKFTK